MSHNNSFSDTNKQIKDAATICGWTDSVSALNTDTATITRGTVTTCESLPSSWPLGRLFPENAKTRYFSFVERTFRDMHEMIQKKSHDYSEGDDPFVNFKTSEDLGVDKLVGLNVRLLDKVARIKSFSRSGNLKNESVEDAYKDLIGYAILALGMMEEDKRK